MFRFETYNSENEKVWDDFIYNHSINGTILHTQKFLKYHPKGRFENMFFMIYNQKDNLVALCPGCISVNDGQKEYYSYKGSTFGGLILSQKVFNVGNLIEIIQQLIVVLKNLGIERVYIKQTSRIFSKKSDDMFEYVFRYLGFKEYTELSTYVNIDDYRDTILGKFSKGKRCNVNACIKAGMIFKELTELSDIEQFYNILEDNLKKYNVKPVHTLNELYELKNRLGDDCLFFGISFDGKIVSGAFVFRFGNMNVLHTQYLAADMEYNKLSPMTFLYYKLIEYCIGKNYSILSWGISTEDRGLKLNMGLLSSKEYFGSEYCNNRSYEMILID